MTTPILVAHSPDAGDDSALSFAAAASRFTGAPLIVVAVHPGGSVLGRLTGGEFAEEAAGDGGAHEQLEADLAARGVAATARIVEHTTPARGLAHAVEELQPGLVVVGSTGRGRLGRVLPGSTAERLIHGSPCPVVVVPQGHEMPEALRKIGAAFVPTDEGREALRTAAVLARAAGAHLRVVMVLSAAHADDQSPGMMAHTHHDQDAAEDVAARHRIGAEEAMREAIAELAPGLDAEPDVLFQDPANGVVAASGTVDLLVIGSRAYGPARAVTLGGVARRVTANAECPVLVLPRGAERQIDALLSGTEMHVAS